MLGDVVGVGIESRSCLTELNSRTSAVTHERRGERREQKKGETVDWHCCLRWRSEER